MRAICSSFKMGNTSSTREARTFGGRGGGTGGRFWLPSDMTLRRSWLFPRRSPGMPRPAGGSYRRRSLWCDTRPTSVLVVLARVESLRRCAVNFERLRILEKRRDSESALAPVLFERHGGALFCPGWPAGSELRDSFEPAHDVLVVQSPAAILAFAHRGDETHLELREHEIEPSVAERIGDVDVGSHGDVRWLRLQMN